MSKKKLSFLSFLLAMLAILLLGSGGAFGLNLFLNSGRPKTLLSLGPVTSPPTNLNFNLSSPDDNTLVYDPNLLVQGKTSPHAIVIITDNNHHTVVDDTGSGDFSSTVKLDSGLNKLSIITFDPQGNSKRENRTIYYSTEKL